MKLPTSTARVLPLAIMTVVSIAYVRSNPVIPSIDAASRMELALNYLANLSIACAATLAGFFLWELLRARLWPGEVD